MSITINNFSPNTQAKSSEVNTNFANLKTAAENASYRAFPWGIKGTLAVADEQGMKWIVPQDLTVVKIWYYVGSATNAEVRIQRDTTTVDTFTATSSVGSTTSFDSATLTAGEVLTLDITAVSGTPADLWVMAECRVTDNF